MLGGSSDWTEPKKDANLDDYIEKYPMDSAKLTKWRCNIFQLKYGLPEGAKDAKTCEDVEDFDKLDNLYPFSPSVISKNEVIILKNLPT